MLYELSITHQQTICFSLGSCQNRNPRQCPHHDVDFLLSIPFLTHPSTYGVPVLLSHLPCHRFVGQRDSVRTVRDFDGIGTEDCARCVLSERVDTWRSHQTPAASETMTIDCEVYLHCLFNIFTTYHIRHS